MKVLEERKGRKERGGGRGMGYGLSKTSQERDVVGDIKDIWI